MIACYDVLRAVTSMIPRSTLPPDIMHNIRVSSSDHRLRKAAIPLTSFVGVIEEILAVSRHLPNLQQDH